MQPASAVSLEYRKGGYTLLDKRILPLIGAPFVDGGRGPDKFDCWGLVREIYHRYGIELPDYKIGCYEILSVMNEMERNRPMWKRCEWPDLPVPCVVAFKVSAPMVNHVGVYIGDGKFIHTREKAGAVIERLDAPAWKHRLEGFYSPCIQT